MFKDDPAHVGNKIARLIVHENNYYALFEVWGDKNVEAQYHASMELLEHGLGMERQDFCRLHGLLQRNLAHQYPPSPAKTPDEQPPEPARVPEPPADNGESPCNNGQTDKAPEVYVSPPKDTAKPETVEPKKKRRSYKRKLAAIETSEKERSNTAVKDAEKTLPSPAESTPTSSQHDDDVSSCKTPAGPEQPKRKRQKKDVRKAPERTTPDSTSSTADSAAKPTTTGRLTKNGKRLGRPPKAPKSTSPPVQPQPQVQVTDRSWASIPGTAFAEKLQKLQTHNGPVVSANNPYQRKRLCASYGEAMIIVREREMAHVERFASSFRETLGAFCALAGRYRDRHGCTYELSEMAAKVVSELSPSIGPLPVSDYTKMPDWQTIWNLYMSKAARNLLLDLALKGIPLEMNQTVILETVQLVRGKAWNSFSAVLVQVKDMILRGEVF